MSLYIDRTYCSAVAIRYQNDKTSEYSADGRPISSAALCWGVSCLCTVDNHMLTCLHHNIRSRECRRVQRKCQLHDTTKYKCVDLPRAHLTDYSI